MKNNLSVIKPVYYNSMEKNSLNEFIQQIKNIRKNIISQNRNIVFLCIGSDRATGDCFGPLVGETLKYHFSTATDSHNLPSVYGSLQSPVHALNLEDCVRQIKCCHQKPYIIAVDASLGIKSHIGYVTYANSPLSPGIGVQKKLPDIGDASITGIVNLSGSNCHMTLQSTRLATVISLSNFVSQGILEAFNC